MAAEALGIYLTGASATGRSQRDARASLGGFRSGVRAEVLVCDRPQALPGVAVRYVAGENGAGIGQLAAVGLNTLTWQPPGAALAGAAVEVLAGARAVLRGPVGEDEAGAWIEVERTGTENLAGVESIGIRDVYNNVIGGAHIFAAAALAGTAEHAAVMLVNEGAGDITALTVWIDAASSAGLAFAGEAVDVDGAIQVIATATTAPTGLTWQTGESVGTGLVIGTLAAGAQVGLWVRRTVGPAAAQGPLETVILRLGFTHAAETSAAALRGLYAVQGVAQYELYAELGHMPDPATDTLRASGAGSPLAWATALAAGVWYPVVYRRNSWGLLGAAHEQQPMVIDGAGDAYSGPPSIPQVVSLTAVSGGRVTLKAVYHAVQDSAARRATHWRVWMNFDGTTPDPDVDVPYLETAMNGQRREVLSHTTGALLDDTEVVAVVRTVRDLGEATEVWSADSEEVSATAVLHAPMRVRAVALRGGHGLTYPPAVGPEGAVEYLDEDETIRFVFWPGRTEFWIDTELVWVIGYDAQAAETYWWYIPSEWEISTGTVSGAASIAGGVEVVSPTELYVVVNQVRRLAIDVTAMTITAASWSVSDDLPVIVPTVGAWGRYGDTLFPVWDPDREDYRPVVRVTVAGVDSAVNYDATLDQAAVEALW
ncbi:MAG: hypothetical protein HYV27_15335 [Candidatus Hydrogenedentes bacterium]|nr:hypothetical protein [Candidatus Hydrogenedentota bacterium]